MIFRKLISKRTFLKQSISLRLGSKFVLMIDLFMIIPSEGVRRHLRKNFNVFLVMGGGILMFFRHVKLVLILLMKKKLKYSAKQ